MSAPPTSLPAEIAELMWQETVCQYQKFTGDDGNGNSSYASAEFLTCWCEPHSYVGMEAERPVLGHQTLGVDTEPVYDLYFDPTDPTVQAFSLDDRFTLSVIAGAPGLKPREISTFQGPNFLNAAPWLCVIRL